MSEDGSGKETTAKNRSSDDNSICLPVRPPPVWAGAPVFPLSIFYTSSFAFSTFPFLSLALPFFSYFVYPFSFYQNSPTPFPGRRS